MSVCCHTEVIEVRIHWVCGKWFYGQLQTLSIFPTIKDVSPYSNTCWLSERRYLKDRLSLSILGMQETWHICCKRQQMRVDRRERKRENDKKQVTDWWGDIIKMKVCEEVTSSWKKNQRKRSRRKLRWGMSNSLANKQVSQRERQLCTCRPF